MITRSLVSCAALVLLAGSAQADEGLKETLLARENTLIEAIKEQDRTKLKEMLSQQAFAVTAEGGRQATPSLLRTLEDVTMTSYRLDDVKCVPISDNVAILTYKYTWSGTYEGRSVPPTTVFATSTWTLSDGVWKSAFYQETPLPQVQTASID